MDFERGLEFEEGREERTESERQAIVRATGGTDQQRFAVDIPANDLDQPLGKQQGGADCGKVFRGVIQDRKA